jgi:periplasmic protein TonB
MGRVHTLLEEKPEEQFERNAAGEPFVGPGKLDLKQGMLEFNHMKKPRSFLDGAISFIAHAAVVVALILIPLLVTHAVELPKSEMVFLAAPAPPPPPPPPPPAAAIRQPVHHHLLFQAGKLYTPAVIPKHVKIIKDEEVSQAMGGVPGGVIGGVPGGTLGGVMGGVLSGRTTFAPPKPKPVVPSGPIRVGGNVRPPQLIRRVQPQYPPLAMEARVQGNVVIDSVIDKQGNVTQMRVVSGNPLLIQAAMSALREWKYQPTLLNGTPVSVEMLVTIHFNLQ